MTALGEVRAATLDEWDAAYGQTSGRTYFQSVGWAKTWIAYHRGHVKAAPLHFTFDDGVSGVVPLVEYQTRSRLIPVTTSSVVGTYGGVLGGDDLTAVHLSLVIDRLGSVPAVDWMASPFASLASRARGEDDLTTRVVMLEDGMTATKSRMSKGHRSALTQAVRSGVTIRRGSTEADWRDYFGLYRRSLDRWGRAATNRYRWRLFELLQQRDPDVTLWLADIGGHSVAGAVTVGGDQYVGYWHGAASEAAFPARAVNLLLTTAMEDATSRGVRYFDLLPSGGHDGVEAFKRSFGAAIRQVPRLRSAPVNENPIGRAYAVARWVSTSARSTVSTPTARDR